ncbi:MAG: endonuclease/exonuclease/phosphatase family protein [Mangrovibacterium sp.]
MKINKTYLLLLILTIGGLFACSDDNDDNNTKEPTIYANNLSVMSFNIRYGDNDGANDWIYRKDLVQKAFADLDVDIAGLQEVVAVQHQDLQTMLPDYAISGSPTGATQYGGVWSPIMYKKDAFELLDSGDFWLSETPETESLGWDAAFKRIVSWVKLRVIETGAEIYFFNTHFDHKGEVAKQNSSKVLMKKLNEIVTPEGTCIVSGDLNSDNTSGPYKIITSKANRVIIKDTKEEAETPYTGPETSFNGFGNSSAYTIIDFLFVTRNIHTLTYDIPQIREGNVYISDHYPVISTIGFD